MTNGFSSKAIAVSSQSSCTCDNDYWNVTSSML